MILFCTGTIGGTEHGVNIGVAFHHINDLRGCGVLLTSNYQNSKANIRLGEAPNTYPANLAAKQGLHSIELTMKS